MVVMIPERFKFRSVKSRMSAFVDRFSMAKSSSESANSVRKPGIRLGLKELESCVKGSRIDW